MHEEAQNKAGKVREADAPSVDRLRLLVEQLPLGIFALDSEGNILEANSALLSMFGIASAEAARNINMLSFPPLLQADIAQDVQRCLDSGEMVTADRPFVSEQDKSAYLRLHLIPIPSNRSASPA